MGPLQLGTLLLNKYRVDRFHEHGDGVGVYDGVDTTGERPVRVRVRRGNVPLGAPGANVVDVVTRGGFIFVVESDAERKPKRSSPPPLPRPRAPEIEIPIFDEDVLVEETPPPPPPTPEAELDMEVTVDLAVAPFERAMRWRRRSRWAAAILAAASVTAVVGWLAGNAHEPSTPTVAAAPPPPAITEAPPVERAADPVPEPSAAPAVVEPAPAASDSAATPTKRKPPKQDPLTL